MRTLCPVDFSSASINACGWAARLLEHLGGGELELLHCINVVSRSAMFIKLDDVFEEQAARDFEALTAEVAKIAPQVTISTRIVNQDPKIYILAKAKVQQGLVIFFQSEKVLPENRVGPISVIEHSVVKHVLVDSIGKDQAPLGRL